MSLPKAAPHTSEQTLEYLEKMLAELRSMSADSGEHFLTYLIEMAYREAKSLHAAASGSVIQLRDNPSAEQLAEMYMNGTLD